MASFDQWYEALASGAPAVYTHTLATARPSDQQVGQQGFSTTHDILALGRALGVGPGQTLLDVCCGPGGPAALLATRLGCRVTGLDSSLAALRLAIARREAMVRYVAGDALRQPFSAASFDAALVLDSLAAIPDKAGLLRELARVLVPGGRFACTAEAGEPFGPAELATMAPGAEAHVIPAATFLDLLRGAGFQPLRIDDHTAAQAGVARRLAEALIDNRAALVAELGVTVVDNLTATIVTWADLLARGRVAMLAIVAERLG